MKVLEVLGGLLVAIPRTLNLGLLLLGPFLVNIAAFHVFVSRDGITDPVLIALCLLAVFLLWSRVRGPGAEAVMPRREESSLVRSRLGTCRTRRRSRVGKKLVREGHRGPLGTSFPVSGRGPLAPGALTAAAEGASMTNRWNLSGLVACLCAVPLLAGCRTMGMVHSQGGISVTSGELEIDCDVHGGQVAFSFSGLSIVSSRGPITRTVWKLGVDSNGNGVLDPGEVRQSIDNPHPGQTSTIAAFQGSMSAGQTVIAHVEVYTSGTAPIYSNTWDHS